MQSLSLMLFCRSFLRVRLMWALRVAALRCCQCWMVLAVASISAWEARPLSHQLRTRPLTAVWTWQTVNSGFFFPQLVFRAGQEQVADTSQD